MNTMFKKSALAAVIALLAANAQASGFQVNEHSASGLGRAFAGEGVIADNASVLARNPAAMMMFDKVAISVAATMIDPDYNVDGTFTESVGRPSSVNASAENAAPNATIPAAYFIMPINDQWAAGFAMMTNYGLGTHFADSFGAGGSDLGGINGGTTSLASVNLNPNIAYRINDQWSIGGGVNLTIAKAELDRVNPNDNTTIANFDGMGTGWGWNIGALYEINKDNRLGLTYRSQIDVDVEGDYHGALPTAPSNTDVDATVALPMPAIAELSGYHRLNQQFALHYSVMWTDWSQFEKLEATGSGCSDTLGNVCLEKDEQLQDAMRYAVGGTWYINPQWEARAGIAYDESAVQKDHATISLPDSDKMWYSVGATYHIDADKSIDFGMAYIDGEDSTFTEGPINNGTGHGGTNNFNWSGTTTSDAFLASVQFNMQF